MTILKLISETLSKVVASFLNSIQILLNFLGDSALHIASRGDFVSIVALLLAFGAKSHILNYNKTKQTTPREDAKEKALETYKLYEKYGIATLMNQYPIIAQLNVFSKQMVVNDKNESIREEAILMDLLPKSCKSILLFGFPRTHKLVSSVKSLHIEIYGKDNLQRETKKTFENINLTPEKVAPYLLASYFTTGNELGF